MMPTLDAALLCTSRTGAELGCESELGVPDSVYARFDIISDTCHLAPCYLNSDKVFLLLSDRYHNPELGFEPGSSAFNWNIVDGLNHSATTAGFHSRL